MMDSMTNSDQTFSYELAERYIAEEVFALKGPRQNRSSSLAKDQENHLPVLSKSPKKGLKERKEELSRSQPNFNSSPDNKNNAPSNQLVGLEIEKFAFHTTTNKQPKLAPLTGKKGIFELLTHLEGDKEAIWQIDPDGESKPAKSQRILLKLKLKGEGIITFEPGGQIEISTNPKECVFSALNGLSTIQGHLDQAFDRAEIKLCQLGINPWHKVDEIGLRLTKPRYQAMDQYFSQIGEFGRRMMRQTCTIQVNLDFGDSEETLVKRFLLANLLAPFGTAIFANSPICDSKVTGYLSFRGRSWYGLDPSRTGFCNLKGIVRGFNKASCVKEYLKSVLAGKIIFIAALDSRHPIPKKITFDDWLKEPIYNVKPTLTDFKNHLSLYFPEVRARGFLELRSVDCQNKKWQAIPALFYPSLLYDSRNLDEALELLLPQIDNIETLLQKSFYGLKDQELSSLANRLMVMALEGINRLGGKLGERSQKTQEFKAYLEHFTQQNRTPADDILDVVRSSPNQLLTWQHLLELEEKWEKIISC